MVAKAVDELINTNTKVIAVMVDTIDLRDGYCCTQGVLVEWLSTLESTTCVFVNLLDPKLEPKWLRMEVLYILMLQCVMQDSLKSTL